jgi:sn-glycerol 3-phosphate transport system substrate-binding protein
VLALLAAACGSDSSSDGGNGDGDGTQAAVDLPPCPVDALDDATEPVEVVMWFQLLGNARDTLEAMVADYNASQDKVRVRAENQGESYDELLRRYEQGIPTGELPQILVAEDTATKFLVDSDTVLPAQSCFDADGLDTSGFLPAAVNHYTVGGALWPASASISDILTYFNKNHFRRADLDPEDPPGTLAEVRDAAEKIKAAGVTDTPVVLLLSSWFLETQLTGSGQPLVNNENGSGPGETTEALYDTDDSRAIVEWISEMTDAGLLLPVPATDGQIDHYLAMAAQNASITLETSTAATTIQDFLGGDTSVAQGAVDDADVDTSGLDIAAGPVFGVDAAGKAAVGGNGFYITSTSSEAQQAAAWDFLKWWNEPAQQTRWHVEGSYLPFLTSVVDTPEVQAFWNDTLAGGFLRIAWDELTESADPDFTGALIGPYDKFRIILPNMLESVTLQGTDPDVAIQKAVEESNAALQQYNDTNF